MEYDQSRESPGRFSKAQQEPEYPGDGEKRFVVRSTKTTNEPVLGHRLHVLALRVADLGEPALVRIELDVRGEIAPCGRAGHDDHHVGPAVVQRVGGYHDRRPTPRLLATDGSAEVHEPDVAPTDRHAERSDSELLSCAR